MASHILTEYNDVRENLDEFAVILPKACQAVASLLGTGTDGHAAIRDAWAEALEGDQVQASIDRDGLEKISFPVPRGASDKPLVASIKRNTSPSIATPWVVVYAGEDRFGVLRSSATPPAARILDFAYMPWGTVLADLAHRALPEPWGFSSGDMQVLRSYVTYTFHRLECEDKVLEGRDLAAFNTGLVSPSYDDIYMCFTPNEPGRPCPWRYEGVCVSGERGLGKRLVSTFSELPRPARYVTDVNQLVFDSSRSIYVDYQHIIVDNIDRIPLGFLRAQLPDHPEVIELIDTLAAQPGLIEDALAAGKVSPDVRRAFDDLRDAVEGNPAIFTRLRNRVRDAVDFACRRVRWNYRTAIPSYYPRFAEMNLLLPLCLERDGVTDVALVVRLEESGNYQGQTILTMRQAYLNARLVCRPESDWLVV